MESREIIEEIPEKRKNKCWANSAVYLWYIIRNIFLGFPFTFDTICGVDDGQNRISRINKLCLLYAEILLLFIISGLFFNLKEVNIYIYILYIYIYI